jgi:hypothetical protein
MLYNCAGMEKVRNRLFSRTTFFLCARMHQLCSLTPSLGLYGQANTWVHACMLKKCCARKQPIPNLFHAGTIIQHHQLLLMHLVRGSGEQLILLQRKGG